MAAFLMDDCTSHEESKCEDCRKGIERHTFVHIVEIGIVVDHVVPSFPMFKAKLKHVKYTLDDEATVFDGFVLAKGNVSFKTLPWLHECLFLLIIKNLTGL